MRVARRDGGLSKVEVKTYEDNLDDPVDDDDLSLLIEEIMHLKKTLMKKITVIVKDSNVIPIDITKLFTINTDHSHCESELKCLQHQLQETSDDNKAKFELITQQKQHISTLQDKVQVLNRNIDEQENEIKQLTDRLRTTINEERSKWQERCSEMENINRTKLNDLEQQLQKQRQRSLQLLEEKEDEIKTLQTSFEIIHGGGGGGGAAGSAVHHHQTHFKSTSKRSNRRREKTRSTTTKSEIQGLQGAAECVEDAEDESMGAGGEINDNYEGSKAAGMDDHDGDDENNGDDDEEDNIEEAEDALNRSRLLIKTKQLSLGESCHMLHYANELARKDIEIANLRKTKYSAEQLMRTAIQEKIAVQEKLREQINNLEEQVDR